MFLTPGSKNRLGEVVWKLLCISAWWGGGTVFIRFSKHLGIKRVKNHCPRGQKPKFLILVGNRRQEGGVLAFASFPALPHPSSLINLTPVIPPSVTPSTSPGPAARASLPWLLDLSSVAPALSGMRSFPLAPSLSMCNGMLAHCKFNSSLLRPCGTLL